MAASDLDTAIEQLEQRIASAAAAGQSVVTVGSDGVGVTVRTLEERLKALYELKAQKRELDQTSEVWELVSRMVP